ncbi:MAG: hypothetical protein K0S55_1789, partial [Clostridia bacterium]|nr:hypothetical protein [Clostridia bacterium]
MSIYNISRLPDKTIVKTENGTVNDTEVRFELSDKNCNMKVFVKAKTDNVKYVYLIWNTKTDIPVRIMGDDWERGYGTLEWRGIAPERIMPWY